MPKVDFMAFTPVVGAAAGAAADVAAAAFSGAGQTRFSVDPDEAKKLIKGLEEAMAALIELRAESDLVSNAGAPAKDPYSGYATLAIRQSAGKDPGGYGWANEKAVEALENTIKNIEDALKKYSQTEEAARHGFKG